MSGSQVALSENRKKHLGLLEQAVLAEIPGVSEGVEKVWEAAYAEGALSTKTKRLMARVVALGAGCRNCVLAQTELALNEGASKREFLEALAVVVSMRGTTGIAESLRVVQYLSEKGIW